MGGVHRRVDHLLEPVRSGTAPANSGSMYTDPNNPCYNQSAAEVFQVPQFWFNMLLYVSGKSCFTISDPGIIQ